MADGLDGEKTIDEIKENLPGLVRDELDHFEKDVKGQRAGGGRKRQNARPLPHLGEEFVVCAIFGGAGRCGALFADRCCCPESVHPP